MSKKQSPGRKFEELIRVMAILRGKNGCPWDKIQDEHSIAGYFLEEVCEAADAEKGSGKKSARRGRMRLIPAPRAPAGPHPPFSSG